MDYINSDTIVKLLELDIQKISDCAATIKQRLEKVGLLMLKDFDYQNTESNRIILHEHVTAINDLRRLASSVIMLYSTLQGLSETLTHIKTNPILQQGDKVNILTMLVAYWLVRNYADENTKQLLIKRFNEINWLLTTEICIELNIFQSNTTLVSN